MEVTHLTNNTCAFFQAIDNYSAGQGITFTMLPSMAAFGRNSVIGLIPFTQWLLEPFYGLQPPEKPCDTEPVWVTFVQFSLREITLQIAIVGFCLSIVERKPMYAKIHALNQ